MVRHAKVVVVVAMTVSELFSLVKQKVKELGDVRQPYQGYNHRACNRFEQHAMEPLVLSSLLTPLLLFFLNRNPAPVFSLPRSFWMIFKFAPNTTLLLTIPFRCASRSFGHLQ